jgi:hypothetical protein
MPNRIRFGTVPAASISAFRLVTVPSYEDRFLFSLDRACDVLNVKNVTFLLFVDYVSESVNESDIDAEAAAALRKNYEEARRRLKRRGVILEVIETKLGDLAAFSSLIQAISWSKTVLDISTMPRSHILTALRFAEPDIETIIYTQGTNRREGEDSFAIGVRDILTLPGFEGQMGHRPTLLVMSIGYEGARAYSLYRRYEPTATIACLGDPGPSDNERAQILETVKRNNGPLLATGGVKICPLPSYDPLVFADKALEMIDEVAKQLEKVQGFPPDVVLSPLGTKAQTLGLFSIWRERPEYQIAYAIPTTRRLGTVGAGNTNWFARLAQ